VQRNNARDADSPKKCVATQGRRPVLPKPKNDARVKSLISRETFSSRIVSMSKLKVESLVIGMPPCSEKLPHIGPPLVATLALMLFFLTPLGSEDARTDKLRQWRQNVGTLRQPLTQKQEDVYETSKQKREKTLSFWSALCHQPSTDDTLSTTSKEKKERPHTAHPQDVPVLLHAQPASEDERTGHLLYLWVDGAVEDAIYMLMATVVPPEGVGRTFTERQHLTVSNGKTSPGVYMTVPKTPGKYTVSMALYDTFNVGSEESLDDSLLAFRALSIDFAGSLADSLTAPQQVYGQHLDLSARCASNYFIDGLYTLSHEQRKTNSTPDVTRQCELLAALNVRRLVLIGDDHMHQLFLAIAKLLTCNFCDVFDAPGAHSESNKHVLQHALEHSVGVCTDMLQHVNLQYIEGERMSKTAMKLINNLP